MREGSYIVGGSVASCRSSRRRWPDCPNLDEATAAKVWDSDLRIEGVTEAMPKERRMELEVEDKGELEG